MPGHIVDKARQDALTPDAALALLKEGNERFVANKPAAHELLRQVDETAGGQWPFAVILSCIDSRTSAELTFDLGIGDVFSIRIAGNFLNEDILGSMEFACHVAGAKLVVVLGHSHCGAIKGACDGVELGNLTQMLGKIAPAVACVDDLGQCGPRSSSNDGFVDAVARENVQRSVREVTERSEVLAALKDAGKIDVVGGMYDITTGKVEFF